MTTHVCVWCGHPIGADCEHLVGRVRCKNCGVATTDPWPSEAELDAAYGTWYRPSSGRFSGVGDIVLRRTRGRLAYRLDRIAPRGPVLDVGSGEGVLLDALRARGRDAVGLERDAVRSDTRTGRLREIDGSWAAVVFWHSLEHLPDAREAVDHAAALLAPGGVLVIAAPNASSLQARVFGDLWLALDLPRHMIHVPARALMERLQALSLEVERVSFWRGGQVVFGWLHGMVGILPGHPDIYDAIRRPAARQQQQSRGRRVLTLTLGTLLTPLAVLAAAIEIALQAGGTVYVEARRV